MKTNSNLSSSELIETISKLEARILELEAALNGPSLCLSHYCRAECGFSSLTGCEAIKAFLSETGYK